MSTTEIVLRQKSADSKVCESTSTLTVNESHFLDRAKVAGTNTRYRQQLSAFHPQPDFSFRGKYHYPRFRSHELRDLTVT